MSGNINISKKCDRGNSVHDATRQPPLPRAKSWANPSSKFNKILNNLEKSILSQFNNSINNNSPSTANSQSITANRHKLSHHQTNASTTTKLDTQNDQQQKNSTTSNDKRIALHQQQKQLKSEPAATKVKNTFNKYQQQIVSSMRHSSNHLQHNNTSCSPLTGSNNNKLSIPPPHANDEARNQSHRMLFGAPTNTDGLSDTTHKVSLAIGSSATLRPNKRKTTTRVGDIIRLDDSVKPDFALRVSSSPASSAKSLPTTITTSNKSSSGSQTHGSNNSETKANTSQEDEESGFSTYQSNRSLIATNYTGATASTGEKSNENQTSNKSNNNMIIMQTQTQVSPLISGPIMSYSSNPSLVPQKMMYGYNQQALYPQQTLNTQHHQFINQSNQVPILSTMDQVVATTNNCYTNSNQSSASHQQTMHQPMRLSQSSINSSSHFNDLQHHQNQTHPFVGMYQGAMTVPMPPPPALVQQQTQHQHQNQLMAASLDSGVGMGQEIYANAPPKPRRYQYYDATGNMGQPRFSHHPLMLAPPQMLTTKPPATMITTTTTALPTSTNNNNNNNPNAFYHHHQQYNGRNYQHHQSIPNHQPSNNISYHHQAPNMYQQWQHQHQQQQPSPMTNNGRLNPLMNGNQYNTLQQRPVPPLPPGQAGWMTKSKSSLDAGDLMRYKLNKNSTHSSNTQHHQTIQTQLINKSLNQQQQQQLYGSHFDLQNNRLQYPTINNNQKQQQLHQQQQMQCAQTNLQRSKSVTQLVPDYEPQSVMDQQMSLPLPPQRQQYNDLLLTDSRRPINGSGRFLSSISTTNLNYVGVQNEQNQSPNYSSQQTNNLNNQRQYHVQQPSNQMYATTLQRQQRHQQKMTNCWPSQHNQASPNGFDTNQHQRTTVNSTNIGAAKTTNSSPTVSGNAKIVRQSQGEKFANNTSLNQDGSQKPSLDDKIRFLMTSGGDEACSGGGSGVGGFIRIEPNSKIVVLNQQVDGTNLNQSWNTVTEQQQVPSNLSSTVATDCFSANSSSRPQNLNNAQSEGTASDLLSTSRSNNHLKESSNGLIFLDEYVPSKTMGNRNQRQYQVQNEQQISKLESSQVKNQHHQTASSVSQNELNTSLSSGLDGQKYKGSTNANSQLIVDLTTPRVLAKTQTTLLSAGSHLDLRQNKESNSINQVGLPQLYSSQQEQHQHQRVQTDPINTENELIKQASATTSMDDNAPSRGNICERTAPYYYSDLKSEEQRQALLSIVQQKSLSPPPQLLSRGLDQSGTRLTLKSTTLHPGQAKALSANLAQRQRQKSIGDNNCFSNSTSDIATRNGHKLSKAAASTHNVAQSMLALNSCNMEKDSSGCNVQSAVSSKSVGGGYFDGELKPSKSKSLENLNQRTSHEGLDVTSIGNVRQTINKFGVPVYENICRSDKLMSAINNSTTCLSSAKSRANRRPQVDGLGNSANQQQLQGKCTSVSDESMDSILGSSLDESDSSLDIIDEIKLSPTDNHLSDICKLIEQLKLNHSKLSEEYKSTLVKISKTINSSNKQDGDEDKNGKLSRRLHLLELKSKKCEARSKNQLALIQMMENVLKQSKLRSAGPGKRYSGKQTSGVGTTRDNFSKLNGNGVNDTDLPHDLPCLPFDLQKADPSQATNTDQSLLFLSSSSNKQQKSTNASPAIPERACLIRAFVTESELHPGVKQLPTAIGDANKQISLSTRHHRQSGSMQHQLRQQSKSSAIGYSDKPLDKSRSKQQQHHQEQQQKGLDVEDNIVSNNNNNNSTNGGSTMKDGSAVGGANANGKSSSKESDAEDEAESSSGSDSGSSVSLVSDTIRRNQQKVAVAGSGGSRRAAQATTASPIANGSGHNPLSEDSLMMKGDNNDDDEDFIEFLSADTSSHRSQFEASQFSASDFNTSASNTSESASSSSGANNDSLNSPLPAKDFIGSICESNSNNNNKSRSSSLFSGASTDNRLLAIDNNNRTMMTPSRSKCEMSASVLATKSASGYCSTSSSTSNDGGKFKNVLGNVIDVDVCPLNNIAHTSSPVNNQV